MVDGDLISTGLILICVGVGVVFAGGVALIVKQAITPAGSGTPAHTGPANSPEVRPAAAPERVHQPA